MKSQDCSPLFIHFFTSSRPLAPVPHICDASWRQGTLMALTLCHLRMRRNLIKTPSGCDCTKAWDSIFLDTPIHACCVLYLRTRGTHAFNLPAVQSDCCRYCCYTNQVNILNCSPCPAWVSKKSICVSGTYSLHLLKTIHR